jgi:hypothetical protein
LKRLQTDETYFISCQKEMLKITDQRKYLMNLLETLLH